MDFAREQERMTRMMELQRGMQAAMVRAMPGVCAPEDVRNLCELRDGFRELHGTARPDDMLVTLDMLNDTIADATEWIARAHDSRNECGEAVRYYQEARELYAALGKVDAVARIEGKLGELAVQEGDLDGELVRLRERLDDEDLDAVARAKTLVQLGELLCKAGDDFEAEKVLLEAERLLGGTPDLGPDEVLTALAKSLEGISAGETQGADAPIVRAMEVRGLYQRIYFALGNVYRETDPAKAKEYEARVARFDEGGSGLDTAVVSKLMQRIAEGLGS